MDNLKVNLYLAADVRGIQRKVFFGVEPPKFTDGVFLATSRCDYLCALPHRWARDHEVFLEPGEIAIVTRIEYEILRTYTFPCVDKRPEVEDRDINGVASGLEIKNKERS